MRRNVVASLLRGLAAREQLVEHARQDRGLAPERAARRLDEVGAGRRARHVAEGVDVERADEARIQALEVEHPDVASAVPAYGSSTWPPCCAACTRESSLRTVGATMPRRSSSLRDRESRRTRCSPRRGRASCRSSGCARMRAAPGSASRRCRRRAARRCARIARTPRDRACSCAGSRRDRDRAASPTQRLALAEHLTCDRVERIVVHAHERAAQQVDAVEHDAARHRRLAAAEVALGLAEAQRRRRRGRGRNGWRSACGDALAEPSGRSRSCSSPSARRGRSAARAAERVERGALVRRSAWPARASAASLGVDDQDLVDAGRVERDREQPSRALAIRLDVERQHARLDLRRLPAAASDCRRRAGRRRSRCGSPSISQPPLMPRSIRYRDAKRTSASNVSMPFVCRRSRRPGTSGGSLDLDAATGAPSNVRLSQRSSRTAPSARARCASVSRI